MPVLRDPHRSAEDHDFLIQTSEPSLENIGDVHGHPKRATVRSPKHPKNAQNDAVKLNSWATSLPRQIVVSNSEQTFFEWHVLFWTYWSLCNHFYNICHAPKISCNCISQQQPPTKKQVLFPPSRIFFHFSLSRKWQGDASWPRAGGLFGELLASEAFRKGLGGLVIDGNCRDTPLLRQSRGEVCGVVTF